MFNRETNKPLVDLDPEQRSTIYRLLCQFNLENYQQYVEEIVLSGGNLALLLQYTANIFEEGKKEAERKRQALADYLLILVGGKR